MMPFQSGLDRLIRTAYRIGFPLARRWWRWRGTRHVGALVAIWVDGELLLVRNSYRRALSMPGGGVRRNETPRQAAARELREEIGLSITPGLLQPAGLFEGVWDCRREQVHVFGLTLAAKPDLNLDRRETIDAIWFDRHNAVTADTTPAVQAYLDSLTKPDATDRR